MTSKLKLIFTGDIGFDHYMDRQWENENLLSFDVRKFLDDGDFVIGNVEGALIKDTDENFENRNSAKNISHSMGEGAAKFLIKNNIKIWSISNNHIMDKGKDGLVSTINFANEVNAKIFGAGLNRDLASKEIEFGNGIVGMFAICYAGGKRVATDSSEGILNWNEYDIIEKKIQEIKKKNRFCILIVHGGEEWTSLPSPYIRDRYIKYLDMGADIIVGHHPHVPMSYEKINGKMIFYSLGNFIFDTDYQRAQENTDIGVLLRLTFDENDYDFDAMGIKIKRDVKDEKENIIVKSDLPMIFAEVNESEYKLLLPLSIRKHFDGAKKQLKFLWSDIYKDYISDEWMRDHYFETKVGARKNELLDFTILYDELMKIKNRDFEKSKLDVVKEYLIKRDV